MKSIDENANVLKPSLLAEVLDVMFEIKQPVMIWGPPGVGKSQVTAQVAERRGIEFRDVRLSQLDPVDLRGVPYLHDGITSWGIPDFLPQEGSGVLMLDEINGAPPLVAAAAYQLILDRRLGDYVLPDGWVIFAAGNRDSDRGVTHKMPTPLANRFSHFEFAVDNDDWKEWALENDIATEVVAFLSFRPELLHKFDPKSGAKAFPTPRSWEFVSKIIKHNANDRLDYAMVAATVGAGAASEFIGFLRIFRNLPSIDGIFLDPENADVPTDPATLHALTGALARRATRDNFEELRVYVERMPPEFNVSCILAATNRDPSTKQTAAFNKWAVANSNIVM